MDKETLSHYGWIVVLVLILSVMIAMATPFGQYVGNAVKSTTQGLFNVQQKALSAADIEIMGQEFEDILNGGSGGTGTETPNEPEETPTDPEPTECQHTNTTIINASATYTGDTYCNDCKTTIATGILISNPNDTYDHDAPELHPNDGTGVYDGMIVRYGNYEYCYGYVWCIFECDDHEGTNDKDEWSMTCSCKDKCDGWGVKCINNTADPGPIMESINGKPIVDMTGTFKNFDKLVVSPVIPETVEGMGATFYLCTSLVVAPYIPDSVNCVDDMFCCCTSLKTAINIPKSASRLYGMFYGCINLEVAPIIPESEEGAADIAGLFSGCTSLKTYAGSTDPDGDFSNYKIPNSAQEMNGTFANCTSITVAPTIPCGVWTNLEDIFAGCTKLGY